MSGLMGGGTLKLNGGGGTNGDNNQMTGGLQDYGPNAKGDGPPGGPDGKSFGKFAKDFVFNAVKPTPENIGFGLIGALTASPFGLAVGFGRGLTALARASGLSVSDEGPADTSGLGQNTPKIGSTRRVGEEFYGEGNDPDAANWLFEPGAAVTKEQARDQYNDVLSRATNYKGAFGDGKFQDFVNQDETGKLRDIADGLAGAFDQGVFNEKMEFIDIPMDPGLIDNQSGGGLQGANFAIKHVDKEGDVKFYTPNMPALTNAYKEENPDVANQGGNYTSDSDFRRHYEEFGKNEGRNFWKADLFDFSNVGTSNDRLQEDDTSENQLNPYLTDVTQVFKDYTEGKFEDPRNA